MKNNKIKTSDTSVRVMETLKILAKNDLSTQEILNHFEKSDQNNKIFTSEVILKYINTLKVFGLKITKIKDKYSLLNSPAQIELNQNELELLHFLENYINEFPEQNVKNNINVFLQEAEKRFSDKTKEHARGVDKFDKIDLKTNLQKYSGQIEELEKYCTDEQKLKIVFKSNNEKIETITANPIEIKYIEKEVYFSLYNPLSGVIQDIPIEKILKIAQLPLKVNAKGMLSSVTFKLNKQLAQKYILKEDEKLLEIDREGNAIIINQKEDRDMLLKRLMKYGKNCEILSPKTLREEIKTEILNSLNNYS